MEFIREDCIYARQSVDRKDSISIESQIDFCKYELKGGSCRVFKDKGYSGKNTDRPEFQKLLGEIRKGKVRRVIVYKLDRISRSILDFANMMELFQEYDVEFVSSTEKFDTSTPMGRAIVTLLGETRHQSLFVGQPDFCLEVLLHHVAYTSLPIFQSAYRIRKISRMPLCVYALPVHTEQPLILIPH